MTARKENVNNPHPPNNLTGSAYRTAEMSWQEMRGFPSGVEVKILRMDFRSGAKTILVKIPTGGQIHPHRHDSVIQHFIVEGGYETAGQSFQAGTYRLIPQDTDIPAIDAKNGVTFLLVSDPHCHHEPLP
jgi:anti-sigma factor ChrR (cupin superfamily)